ncbi:ankyrin repeat domain-containing protein 50-like [Callospermophilus lateralis]|uniref:ankyrin repeat domain-containing protein 50-like n=1 Tax=Callospermophilus lateralis TaxID=76772 RepID=UPI0040543E49
MQLLASVEDRKPIITNPWEEKVCKMAQTSLLLRKQFYCREWVFHKLQHCLQEKSSCCSSAVNTPSLVMNSGNNPGAVSGKAAAWGVLLVGGPGSGKTALCTELLWPSSPTSLQRGLHHQALAFHFCKAQDSDTLCVGGFVRGLVAQICYSGLLQGYEDKLRDPDIQSRVQPGECERNPAEASKRLGIERGTTDKEALDVIVSLLEEHGQGGNYYEDANSCHRFQSAYLLVDQDEAWVLETAGPNSDYRLLHDSNRYSVDQGGH